MRWCWVALAAGCLGARRAGTLRGCPSWCGCAVACRAATHLPSLLRHYLPCGKAPRPSAQVKFWPYAWLGPSQQGWVAGRQLDRPTETARLRCGPNQGHNAAAAGRTAACNTPQALSPQYAPGDRPPPPATDWAHSDCPAAMRNCHQSGDAKTLLRRTGAGARLGLLPPPQQRPSPQPPPGSLIRPPALL